jgi:hypothetical protein
MLIAGKAYAEEKKYNTAIKFVSEGVNMSQQAGARQSMIDGYQLLSKIYKHFGKLDSAFFYLSKYSNLKDSVLTKKFFSRINDFKNIAENERKQAQMALLEKDNKIKEQQIRQKSLLNAILVGSILTFILLSIIIYRNNYLKRKNELLQNKKAQTELQQQVLRAQMNPHFIFNSLNSINRFILQNNKSRLLNTLPNFQISQTNIAKLTKPLNPWKMK